MFLVLLVSVNFVNGHFSKLDHRLILALSKRLFFVPISEPCYKRDCVAKDVPHHYQICSHLY